MGDTCNQEHDSQLGDYLRFLRRKRDAAIAEVAAEFVDTKETRLFDEEYHVDDVVGIIDGLLSVVRSTMKRDLQTSAFSSVLLLKQTFEQAEERGINLSVDLPSTEDQRLLQAVEQWDNEVHGGSSRAPPPLRARAAVSSGGRSTARALPVIGQAKDPKLLSELQNQKDDNASLQERFNRLQVQCTSALREKSDMQNRLNQMMDSAAASGGDAEVIADLQAQVADLRAALDEAHANGGGGGNVDGLMNELQGLQEHNAQLAAELDAARADAQQRVERSQQFINMRQMLAKKNTVVRQLREQLQAHGIYLDDVDAQDD